MGTTNTANGQTDGTARAQDDMLRAQLAIDPHPDARCVVVANGDEKATVSQQLKVPRSCLEEDRNSERSAGMGECHTEISNGECAGNREYLTSSVEAKCICPVFDEHDCIPDIKGVRSGAVIAVVTIRDRAVLRNLLSDLRAVDARVSIEWLVRAGGTDSTAEIDISHITTKQRETLETALEAGYYETPRETSLTELAEVLSISESAVSQRLNAAETKLVKSFLEE